MLEIIETPATVADGSLADWTENCQQKSPDELGEYFEKTWSEIEGNARASGYLLREMKRKFKLRSRKKKSDGTYETIRGFKSFEKWYVHATGKSARTAYYILQSEQKKHSRNAHRRSACRLLVKPTPDQMKEFRRIAKSRHVSVEDWALARLQE